MLKSVTSGGSVKRQLAISLILAVGLSAPAHAQDAAKGEKDFAVCRACHQIGPTAKNGIGPVLNGIIGRKAGTYPGYNYSEANRDSGIVWTPEELDTYLVDPQKVVPHTKMIFPGLKDQQKRADVIAFLKQYAPDGKKAE
jgi:cytochrome c